MADYFKVLSEVSRLQILCTLRNEPKNVSEIMEATGMGQANVSKHLKVLHQAAMISRHPQGVSVFYKIADPAIFDICDIVCEQLVSQQEQQMQELSALRPN